MLFSYLTGSTGFTANPTVVASESEITLEVRRSRLFDQVRIGFRRNGPIEDGSGYVMVILDKERDLDNPVEFEIEGDPDWDYETYADSFMEHNGGLVCVIPESAYRASSGVRDKFLPVTGTPWDGTTEIDQKLAGMIGVFCDMPGHLDVVSEVVDSLEYIEHLDRDLTPDEEKLEHELDEAMAIEDSLSHLFELTAKDRDGGGKAWKRLIQKGAIVEESRRCLKGLTDALFISEGDLISSESLLGRTEGCFPRCLLTLRGGTSQGRLSRRPTGPHLGSPDRSRGPSQHQQTVERGAQVVQVR